MKLNLSRAPVFTAIAVLGLLIFLEHFRNPNFVQMGVFWDILRNNAYLGILAVGETLVIISGGIDLSVGSMIGLITVLMATLLSRGVHPIVAIVICLAGGASFGGGMGYIITKYKVPPFLVTLGGLFFARGAAYVIMTSSMTISNSFYDKVSALQWVPPLIFLGVIIVCHLLLHFTNFGRIIFAIGGGENSANLMGIKTVRSKVLLYSLSSLLAAIGGIVYTFNTVSGDPTAGVGLELDAITAVVIGGTLLTGGKGGVLGTFVGIILLGAIQVAISFENNVSSWWSRIIVGIMLLIFLILQKGIELLLHRLANKRSTPVSEKSVQSA